MLQGCLNHCRNILGKVLSVGIYSHGMCKPVLRGISQSCLKCLAFATVFVVIDDTHIQAAQLGLCIVSTAVIYHNHIGAYLKRTLHHIGQGAAVVVRG